MQVIQLYFSENINACSDYSERIFRILRKDHGIKSMKHIECPEWKKEIEKENKADKEKAKEDFLFMLDLFNKSYNSGKMDKDTFNDRLYKMLDSLGQKGVYTRKELIEIEAANKKTDEPPSETMPPECVMTPPTELDSSVARENLGFKGKAAGVLANGSYVPIFPVPPVYPRRALERDIEGCVMLKFTVTKTGSTRDPSVEWAVPPGIFDRAAMTSALKYKYKPQIRDGEAIEVPNFRTIVIFKIEDANKPVD